MADEESCNLIDVACKAKAGIGEALTGAAGSALEQIADGVTTGVIDTIASLGTMWTTVGSADLTSPEDAAVAAPARGAFNDSIDTLLGYASWVGLGVAVLGTLFLGVVLVVNARRGDGAGLVNTATMVTGGAALIGSATSVIGFLVPARATQVSGSVGFVQDQTFYLTLALAALSAIIAGAQMAWSQRAEPARDLMKALLTLAVVTASGVAMLNVLVTGADALAVQIIDSAIGEDFQTDVLKLLALDNGAGALGDDLAWLGGNVILIIIGGVVAIVVNLLQVMLMVLRTGMLFLMAGILPLSASFLNTETGRNFFQKVIAWTLAFVFYKPAAALIYAVAIKMSTTGVWEGEDNGLIQFAAGLMMILASVFALPVLIGFLSPVLGAMSSSGGGGLGIAAMGAAIPMGANRLARSGRGFGADTSGDAPPPNDPGPRGKDPSSSPSGDLVPTGKPPVPPVPTDKPPGPTDKPPAGDPAGGDQPVSSPAGGGAGAGTASTAAGTAVPAAGAAAAAAGAAKQAGEAVSSTVQEGTRAAAGTPGSSTGPGGGSGASHQVPGRGAADGQHRGADASPVSPGSRPAAETGAPRAGTGAQPGTGARPRATDVPSPGPGTAPPGAGGPLPRAPGSGPAAPPGAFRTPGGAPPGRAFQGPVSRGSKQISDETGNHEKGGPDGADRT